MLGGCRSSYPLHFSEYGRKHCDRKVLFTNQQKASENVETTAGVGQQERVGPFSLQSQAAYHTIDATKVIRTRPCNVIRLNDKYFFIFIIDDTNK